MPIRKPGKLPYETVSQEYALEYGTDRLEIHRDAIRPGQRVLLLDDVLATGGTMRACCDLITREGGEVLACAFVIELASLAGGRSSGRSRCRACWKSEVGGARNGEFEISTLRFQIHE